MSKTEKNLMDAFAGESQANRKYLAFAKQADKEGLPQVAKLFRAAAEAETIHAHAHLRNAGKIGDTTANLKAAIEGETYEFTKMYPEIIRLFIQYICKLKIFLRNAVKYKAYFSAIKEHTLPLY